MKTLISLAALLAVTAGGRVLAQDVIETNSGERLEGKLVRMAKGKLFFESKALGKTDVDWETIRSITTENEHEIVLKDGDTRRLRFGADEAPPFSEIRLVNPDVAARPWELNVSLGASRSFGNSEITQVLLSARGVYRFGGKDRLNGDFTWLYNEEEDQTTGISSVTQRRTAGSLQYDRFVDEKLYVYGRVSAENDKQQALELRVAPGVGVGYQIEDNDVWSWSVEAGLSWRYEDYKGESPTESWAARFATSYGRKVLENLDYQFDVEWTPSLEDKNDHLVLMRNALTSSLGGGFTASLAWEWDYDTTPAQGNERSDHRFLLTVGVDL